MEAEEFSAKVVEVVGEVNRVMTGKKHAKVEAHTSLLTAEEFGMGREPVLGRGSCSR